VLKFVFYFDPQIAFHECFYVSRHHKCSSISQQHKYNGFQERKVKDTVKSTIGDLVDQVSMNLPIHKDINFFMDKDIKVNGKETQ